MITAIVLAAGLSRRMGRFKLLLPWGRRTVIGQVVATLEATGVQGIVVVTGHRAREIARELAMGPARIVTNLDYAKGEMLSSIQAGLRAMPEETRAALLCLGDQPQIQADTVRTVLAAGEAGEWRHVVIPSYAMRAGHPILLPQWLWPAILAASDSLRAVLATCREEIEYLPVNTPTILADLDTPEDYARAIQEEAPCA